MKRTFKAFFLWLMQLCFLLVVPLIIVWLQQGKGVDTKLTHKIPITAIILGLIAFLIFKRFLIRPLLKKVDMKIANMESLSLMATDPRAIKSLKREYRYCSIFKLVVDLIVPTLLLAIVLITIKAVEKGLLELYGALCFCCISFAAGVLFRVIAIFSGRLEHEESRKERRRRKRNERK